VDASGHVHIVAVLDTHLGLVYIQLGTAGQLVLDDVVRDPTLASAGVVWEYHWPAIAVTPGTNDPVVAASVLRRRETVVGGPAGNWDARIEYELNPLVAPYPAGDTQISVTQYAEYIMAYPLSRAAGATLKRVQFASQTQVSEGLAELATPSVAVDSAGRIHCAWRRNVSGGTAMSQVVYAREDQVGSPGPRNLSGGYEGGWGGRPAVVYDPAGDRLHVAWRHASALGAIRYARVKPADGTCELDLTASPVDAVPRGDPAVAVGGGLVHLLWRNGSGPSVFYTAIRGDHVATVSGQRDFRLSSGSARPDVLAIGANAWGLRSMVWEDRRSGASEIVLFSPPWTFLVYMCEDNSLYAASLREVLNGMELGALNPCVRTVVQFDGTAATDSCRFRIRYDDTADTTFAAYSGRYSNLGHDCWYIGPGGVVPSPGEVDMGNPAALTDFALWGRERFPAKYTLLAIDDHGDGWLPGTGAGQKSGGSRAVAEDNNGTPTAVSSLGMKKLRTALQSSGLRPDILFLDDCLMALTEVAYELRDRCRYLLFSQASIERTSSLYSDHLPGVSVDADALAVSKHMASKFMDFFKKENLPYTMSAVNCAKVKGLTDQVQALTAALMAPPPPGSPRPNLKAKCLEAWTKAQKTDSDGRYTDLYDWCARLKAGLAGVGGTELIQTRAQEVMDLIAPAGDDRLVVAEYHDDTTNRNCHGLSIYLPFACDLSVEGVAEGQEENPGVCIPLSQDPANRCLSWAAIAFPDGRDHGVVRLRHAGGPAATGSAKVWALDSDNRPTEEILAGPGGSKQWDLAVDAQREHFNRVKGKLMVEGTQLGLFALVADFWPWGSGVAGPYLRDWVKVKVFRLDMRTPAGDPVNAPVQGGHGQNEFTYSLATPGVLTMTLEAAVSPAAYAGQISNRCVFAVPAIPGSTLVWDGPNPGGRPTAAAGILSAKVTFTGLPPDNASFGTKKAGVYFNGQKLAEATYEVFFPRDKTNHPSSDPSTANWPNWLYYWSQTVTPLGSPPPTYRYDASGAGVFVPGTTEIPFVRGDRLVRVAPYGTNNPLTGIDCFAWTVAHKSQLYKDWCDLWSNDWLDWFTNHNGKAGPGDDMDGDWMPNGVEVREGYDWQVYNTPTPGRPADVIYDLDDWNCRRVRTVRGDHSQDWCDPGMQHMTKDRYDD
jgi:hypothetical protein